MAEPIGEENSAGRNIGGDAKRTTLHGIDATLAERGARYGDFSDHADLAQKLQDVMRTWAPGTPSCIGWGKLSPVQKQALTVIADKIARILSGDPYYADNWHDIQGYAKLAEDRIETDRARTWARDERVALDRGVVARVRGLDQVQHPSCQYQRNLPRTTLD